MIDLYRFTVGLFLSLWFINVMASCWSARQSMVGGIFMKFTYNFVFDSLVYAVLVELLWSYTKINWHGLLVKNFKKVKPCCPPGLTMCVIVTR